MMAFWQVYLIQVCPYDYPDIFIVMQRAVKDMHQLSCHAKLQSWIVVWSLNIYLL